MSISDCILYQNSVVREFIRKKQPSSLPGTSAAQQVQQPRCISLQSVLFGPGKRQFTLTENSELERPGTSKQRSSDEEPPAKKAAVEQSEALNKPERLKTIVISNSSSTDVED